MAITHLHLNPFSIKTFVAEQVAAGVAAAATAATTYFGSKVKTGTAALNYAEIAAQTATAIATETLTVAVTGAAVGDSVAVGPPAALEAGLIWHAWVSAADTVSIRVGNITAAPINPASATWRATVIKP